MKELTTAISSQNFSTALKILDVEISSLEGKAFASPILAQLYANKGYCNQRLQLYRKALKDYDAALTYNPKDARTLFRKGQTLQALKRTEEAGTSWQQAEAAIDVTTDFELVEAIQAALGGTSGTAPATNGTAAAPRATTANGTPSQTPAVKGAATPAAKPSPPPRPAQPATPPAKPSASPASAGSKTSRTASSASVSQGADVEEVDCVAQQSATSSTPRSTVNFSPASFLARQQHPQLVSQAINLINQAKTDEALPILDKVLTENPDDLTACVARGTARALRRELPGAVEDFTRAIEIEPRFPDSYKRRGVAQSYLGNYEKALEDLDLYLQYAPLFPADQSGLSGQAEAYMERGMIYHKLRDYRRATHELRKAVNLDTKNAQTWNLLGLCCTSQGDIDDGVNAYRQAVDVNPKMKEAWVNMAQALKEQGQVKEADRAFARVFALDEKGSPSVHAFRITAQMRQGKGDHASAIKILDKALPYAKAEQSVELLYIRAICNHALGYMRDAQADYESCMAVHDPQLSEETRTFQFRSYYQKEIALYTYKNLDRSVLEFAPDNELLDVFKESWCKKGPPSRELLQRYQPQPAIPHNPPPPPPRPDADRLKTLTELADKFGALLQNNHQGFLPNVRQQRAAGFGAMELAQQIRAVVEARRVGNPVWVKSEGATSQAGCAGRHQFGWRDAMDIVVKWRQLAEPNDEVVWVDLLTRREFEQGFGSHTPMFSGQTKCVRYYMNFATALELHKKVLLEEGCAWDAQNRKVSLKGDNPREHVKAAKTAEDMYRILGEDCWVVVPISSATRSGHSMEGTRLTLVKVPNQPDSFEFSIRTPVTPPRWKDFDLELEANWELIMRAMVDGDLQAIAKHVLTYCYYWYNFMPLARGTAAVGYTTLLGLLWAAGMPATTPIPKDYQVDWQAILAQHPEQFVHNVGSWLLQPVARGKAAEPDPAASKLFPDPTTLPSAIELLGTMRNRIEALNPTDARRI